MSKLHRKAKGKSAFVKYYRSLFPDTIDSLLAQLGDKSRPVVLVNPQHYQQVKTWWQVKGLTWKPVAWHQWAVYWPEELEFGQKLPGYKPETMYLLNISSLFVGWLIAQLEPKNLLDACAAPGGKTVATALLKPKMELSLNELSPKRNLRLIQVVKDFDLKPDVFWQRPAQTLAKSVDVRSGFDLVLVDAPCSSESHVWRSPKHLAKWSVNRVNKLARQQSQMLTGLSELVNPGGYLLYVTCALNPAENEEVIAGFLEHNPQFQPKTVPLPSSGVGFDTVVTDNLCLRVPVQPDVEPLFVSLLQHRV